MFAGSHTAGLPAVTVVIFRDGAVSQELPSQCAMLPLPSTTW